MLSANTNDLASKVKNAGSRARATKQAKGKAPRKPIVSETDLGAVQEMSEAVGGGCVTSGGRREVPKRSSSIEEVRDAEVCRGLSRQIQTALGGFDTSWDLRQRWAAVGAIRNARICGRSSPFDVLISQLLMMASGGNNPSLEEIEHEFAEYRLEFDFYIADARGALQQYPKLVQGGEQ